MVQWRAGVQWYLLILLGIPILNLLAFLVVPGTFADFVAPSSRFVRVYLSEMVFSLTIGVAPLWEEVGWRGFALPGMQRLHGPVMGTIILGLLWGVWHLPFFFGPLAQTGPDATFIRASIALVEFSIGLTGLSVVMTWVLNNCRGSTLLAILFHAAFDSSGLLNRATDSYIVGGENGLFYVLRLNTDFDSIALTLEVRPEILRYRYAPPGTAHYGIENSLSIVGNLALFADNGGTMTIARQYWSNKNTGLVNDVPGEADLTPAAWGTFTLD
jgi:membrane protease YdiL (CAAX protease family)